MTVLLQVFDGPGQPFRLVERVFDPGTLGDGEALIEIGLATVCGSDLHTVDGTRPERTPCVLGHEAVGRVVAARELEIGERITWTIADSCGACPPCTTFELPQKCEHLFKYGHAPLTDGTGMNGCYATHIVLRRGTHTVPIPDAVPDALAAPANCALATMVNATSRLAEKTRCVVIQGGGLLGVYGCALLVEKNTTVFCTDVDPRRLEMIERFGGIAIDATDSGRAVESIRQRAGTRPIDAVIEVAGIKTVIEEGIELLRPGGFYGLVGLVHPDSALATTAESLIRKCITMRGFHNYAPTHLDAAVAFLERNADRLPFADLVSDPYPLAQLDDAFAATRERTWLRVSVGTTKPAA